MNNSRLIPMDLEDFQLTRSYEPFLFFFLFLLPLLFFSFSLHSFRQVMQHLYHKPMMLRLKGLVVRLVIKFVITLVDLFGSHLYNKRRLMLPFYHISSLKGLVGQLANDFVFILVEASEQAPGMMMSGLRQLIIIRSFQKKIIGWLYSIQMRLLLLEIEDDAQRNSAENGESSIYRNGEDCLYRLAYDLGRDTIAPVAFQQLPVYLNSPRWQEALAGLVALAQLNLFWKPIPNPILDQVVIVALNFFQHHPYQRVRRAAINALEHVFYCPVLTFQTNFKNLVLQTLASALDDQVQGRQNIFDQLLLDLFQNPHRRVRLAGIDATRQLFNDLPPNDQLLYHHLFVLPALAAAMCAFQYPGVQYDAAVAMINISENYPEDTSPYLRETVLQFLRREDIDPDHTIILEMVVAVLPLDTIVQFY